MPYCPYCNKQIQVNWSFCHHCNKPLITNLERPSVPTREYIRDISTNDEYNQQSQDFDSLIYQNEKIDEEISKLTSQIDNITDSNESVGEKLLKIAGYYYQKRDLSNSLKYLENALHVFENYQNVLQIAIVNNEIGLLKEELGYFDEAIYYFDVAIENLEIIEDYPKIIQLYNNIGNAYLQIKDIEQAYHYYQKALIKAEENGLVFDEVKSSSNLVEVLFILKNYDRIKKILNRNLEFFQQNQDSFGMINTLIKYGKLYFYLGFDNLEKSEGYFKQSLELIEGLADQISLIIKSQLQWEIYLFLGKIYLLKDQPHKAEGFLLASLEAIRIYETDNENINQATVLEAIGKLNIQKNIYQTAIEYFSLSAEIYFKYGEDEKVANLYQQIGQIYHINLKNLYKALDFLEKSLKIYDKSNYVKKIADVYQSIASIYVEQNSTELAISNYENALNYYNELQDEYSISIIRDKINSLINKENDELFY